MTTNERKPRKTENDSTTMSWRYGSLSKTELRSMKKWLGAQRNKSEAITQIILHMIQRYGYKDILDFDVQRQLFADTLMMSQARESGTIQRADVTFTDNINQQNPVSSRSRTVDDGKATYEESTQVEQVEKNDTKDTSTEAEPSVEVTTEKPVEKPVEIDKVEVSPKPTYEESTQVEQVEKNDTKDTSTEAEPSVEGATEKPVEKPVEVENVEESPEATYNETTQVEQVEKNDTKDTPTETEPSVEVTTEKPVEVENVEESPEPTPVASVEDNQQEEVSQQAVVESVATTETSIDVPLNLNDVAEVVDTRLPKKNAIDDILDNINMDIDISVKG